MKERRAECDAHKEKTEELRDAMFGNGRPGLKDRVIKLEVMMYIIIGLLLGNGALLAWTTKTVINLTVVASKLGAVK